MEDIQNIGITTGQLDANGYVTIWHIERGEWIKRSPIDAKEGIAYGALTFTPPSETSEVSEPMSEEAIEDRLISMSKSELRQMCVEQQVAHTSADTKQSLIERLIVKGVTFN